MVFDIKRIFENEGETLDFSFSPEVSFCLNLSVTGYIENRAGITTLSYTAGFDVAAPCDRCNETVERHMVYAFSHRLAVNLQEDELSNDILEIPDALLNMTDMAQSDILLELPMKFLCSEECRGLCPSCGKNLNDGDCSCEKREVDPRLAKLLTLLD